MTTPILGSLPQHNALDPETIRRAPDAKEQAGEIGRQFEAMLIQEVIKAARSAGGGGWLGDDANETSEATAEMGEEFLARAMAGQGGLGLGKELAKAIEKSLAAKQPTADKAD